MTHYLSWKRKAVSVKITSLSNKSPKLFSIWYNIVNPIIDVGHIFPKEQQKSNLA